MGQESSRRSFLRRGTAATAGLFTAGAAARGLAEPEKKDEYPRYHPGVGGPVGSPTDRGKLVPGLRDPNLPPVPVTVPDLPKLPFKMVDGVKEFHLHAQPVKVEILPDLWINHWGYNGTMPGPTLEVFQGDRIRVHVHNELPEPTTLHFHGFELHNTQDGIPFVTQNPIMPGKTAVYEFHLHQVGTFIYHPHFAMQEAIGMVGAVIIHPKEPYQPVVDQDFVLIAQEFAIRPASNTPDTTSMDFNFLTFNGHAGPYATPLVCKLGHRVRIRFINFSTFDHHPFHLHGHTWWITGTEGGRIPEPAWIPGNEVLVGVAQVRECEFIANNPGDWVQHCHMFHHMMNHMVSGVGPGSRTMAKQGQEDPRYQVPCYPQGTGMMAMMTPEQVKKITSKPESRGMREHWYMGVHGLFNVLRVLPEELFNAVMSGKGEVKPGASVAGPPLKFE
ncbi:MAG: multicopper oxidase family protein [Gemmataceae bacterium]